MVGINLIEAAIVVKFDKTIDQAPSITYIDFGEEAQKLVISAKIKNIPVIEDNKLGKELVILQEGEYIHERLWKAIAKILVGIIN